MKTCNGYRKPEAVTLKDKQEMLGILTAVVEKIHN